LARRFDVSPETVRDIINRRTWKNLELKRRRKFAPKIWLRLAAFKPCWMMAISVFEVAMRNNITPHELLEFIRKYGE
jgi:hypothetical protein